jgi:signal peptidase II
LPLLLLLDQATKYWVQRSLPWLNYYHINAYLNIVHVHNHGAAFSFLNHPGGWQRWLFTFIALCVTLVLFVWLRRMASRPRCLPIAVVCIMSGAVGNTLDRLRYGYVIDFIDVHWGAWHWPAFNVADALICVGVMWLLWDQIRKMQRAQRIA